MTRWEALEEYLVELDALGQKRFTNRDFAGWAGVDPHEGSNCIQAYQGAQFRAHVGTAYVVHRAEGRTSGTVWGIGTRASDAMEVGDIAAGDFQCAMRRRIRPVLEAISIANPRAATRATAVGDAIDAGVRLLASMLGAGDE